MHEEIVTELQNIFEQDFGIIMDVDTAHKLCGALITFYGTLI
jgi:hypothetical protein